MERLRLTGEVNLKTLVQNLGIDHPRQCRCCLQWLIDLTEAKLKVTNNEAVRFSMDMANYREQTECAQEDCKAALVVADDFNFGVARVLSGYAKIARIDVLVTREMEAALEFLQAA